MKYPLAINMKLHLSALLLFLLLVDKSYFAVSISPKVYEYLNHVGKEVATNLWEEGMKGKESTIVKWFSPPQPNLPRIQKKGFYRFKAYLSNFSYLQSSGPFNDYIDQETISAFKTYQGYFNLQITGLPNKQTIQQMLLPRCAVPDINFNYSFAADGLSWPKAGNTWFPKGKRNLTYGFPSPDKFPANMTKVFRDAFTRWAKATTVLNFTETTYDNADIKGRYVSMVTRAGRCRVNIRTFHGRMIFWIWRVWRCTRLDIYLDLTILLRRIR
ncbi:uncharacterized protein LOC113869551 isoform X2 [Abrus precatorius]|uniref:Uncharacterized protein LOC113869551 isoform X2 n=1 Tax=Abrus precatorius TaxID=3816 RepID=A0A8B8M3F4_ABRPR|nr:uncharacterized protein LOC113869551 isoform X2 [Abrus precatorius]